MQRHGALVALVLVAACGTGPSYLRSAAVIPGAFPPDRGPDSNSVILDAPDGLIVVDTGRHAAHQERLIAYAREHRKPIVAIVNTHWHLDHTGGNAELRAAFPKAEIIATTAIEGALVGFFPAGRARSEARIAAGGVAPAEVEEIHNDWAAVDDRANLVPTRPITRTQTATIAGRSLELHVAPFAATEADLWIYDPATRTVIAGDLVVAPVPFFDTACPRGWRDALAEIAKTPFVRLIPGHGDPMGRATFDRWRNAFDALVACAASSASVGTCVAGWKRDAAELVPTSPDVGEYVQYYVEHVLRDAEASARFCRALR